MTILAMRRGLRLAALVVAAQAAAGCGGGGSKDLQATFNYGMMGCAQLARCSTTPTITGLEGHTPVIRLAAGATLPSWATLNPTTGEVSGVPTGPADLMIPVELTVAGYQGALSGLVLLTVDPLVLTLGYFTLPESVDEVGLPITPFTAAFGGPGYSVDPAPGVSCTYSVSSGAPPPGVTLDPVTGLISGIPTASGIFPYDVTVTLVYQGITHTAVKSKSHRVDPFPTSISYPGNATYLTAGAAMQPLVPFLTGLLRGGGTVTGFHVASGTLPPGLSIDAATGVVSGTFDGTGTTVSQSWSVDLAAMLTRGELSGEVTAHWFFSRSY